MTYYNSAKLVIVVSTLVLLFGSLPQGHAGAVLPEDTGLLNIFKINISGLLVCAPTGNPPSGGLVPGVVGALFGGSCNGASGNISLFTIDQAGAFNAILTVADGLLFHPSTQEVPCVITVQLPVTGTTCTLLPPTGILRTVPQLVSVVTSLTGLIAVVTAGPWVHVP